MESGINQKGVRVEIYQIRIGNARILLNINYLLILCSLFSAICPLSSVFCHLPSVFFSQLIKVFGLFFTATLAAAASINRTLLL